MSNKIWKFAPVDEPRANRLASELNMPAAAARLLASRGFTDSDEARAYLQSRLSSLGDPYELPDIEKAADRIWQAIDRGETIAIYGDYDVDGVSATALMVTALTAWGAKVFPFLPLRLEEGYGLSEDGLGRCIAEHDPKLMVTVDCGTGSSAAVRAASAKGIDVVITDHHSIPSELAPALAVVNPKRSKNEALHVLAGVGVAFKLCHAMAKQQRERAKGFDLKSQLGLVALGTIADIVPLKGENRLLAKTGLKILSETPSIGIQALKKVSGIESEVDVYEVGFRLGPRLNAAGRLGDALNALRLLLTEDAEEAEEIAGQLDASNRERQDVEKAMAEEALAHWEEKFDPARDFAVVASGTGWHPGVVGIVASRIGQRFYRPVVCVALEGDSGRGSCRSIEGFDVVEALRACADLLKKFGGHAMAAGLEISAKNLPAFARRFNKVARERLQGRELRPIQRIDASIALAEADMSLLNALDQMRPFGVGNLTPVWAARGVVVAGRPRIVGQGHLKFRVAQGGIQRDAIAWQWGGRELPEGPLDIAFQVKKNSYMGRETIDLQIQDVRAAGAAEE